MTRRVLTAALLLAACGDPRPLQPGSSTGNPDAGDVPDVGPSTHTTTAECAAAHIGGVALDTLTYSNFGQAFFSSWCTRCHGTTVSGPDRHGAPSDHNFDSLAGVQVWAKQIDQMAGMNPTGSVRNSQMPPLNEPAPGDDDRQRLACFIATGLAP
ncbi:MAG TPA: hypothetical protein VFP65_13485 [Anaeromyxobacteraceae bacterium]|nr:hypothetical protein [Anaeromyxobacteraceae bacterium]